MKIFLTIALLAGTLATSAEITHENQFKSESAKVWVATEGEARGDYQALERDHAGPASLHIRAYAENEKTFLWFTVISQDDIAVMPVQSVHPKYEKSRTDGTWKAADKVEYLKFVTVEGTKGVIFQDRFYKKIEKR
jgi:hypothetical protein